MSLRRCINNNAAVIVQRNNPNITDVIRDFDDFVDFVDFFQNKPE